MNENIFGFSRIFHFLVLALHGLGLDFGFLDFWMAGSFVRSRALAMSTHKKTEQKAKEKPRALKEKATADDLPASFSFWKVVACVQMAIIAALLWQLQAQTPSLVPATAEVQALASAEDPSAVAVTEPKACKMDCMRGFPRDMMAFPENAEQAYSPYLKAYRNFLTKDMCEQLISQAESIKVWNEWKKVRLWHDHFSHHRLLHTRHALRKTPSDIIPSSA